MDVRRRRGGLENHVFSVDNVKMVRRRRGGLESRMWRWCGNLFAAAEAA